MALSSTRDRRVSAILQRLRTDGRCLLSVLFFELIQFIVIRFSIDCIVRWGRETRLMESPGTPPSHRLRISHVINLLPSVRLCHLLSPFTLHHLLLPSLSPVNMIHFLRGGSGFSQKVRT